MSRNIPWLRVAAEGFAILVSILLAFGVQAWWEGRQARNELHELLVLLDDLIASTPGLLDDLAEKEERALTRRELARNRWAALGVRIGDLPSGPRGEPNVADLPGDSPYFTDTELLNLLVMRQTEEYLVINASRALLEHISEIRGRLENLGVGANSR